MEGRTDPARTGVKAGRVVGLLTAGLAAVSLLRVRGSFYGGTTSFLELFGAESWVPVSALFWGNLVFAAVARYSVGYVVGSLIGVLYDWLDRPPLPVLVVIAGIVGLGDGLLAALDTRSIVIGSAYVLAWLCYVPVFAWLFDDDAGDVRTGPRRL